MGLGTRRKDDLAEDVERKTCPRCGSTDTRLSRRTKGVIAAILSAFNMSRYRCRSCKRHFVGRN